MRAVDIILKKKDGESLSKEEIEFFLGSYLQDEIPDYQVSAFLMATLFQGMEKEELAHFTSTMSASGDTISFPKERSRFIIDKHSTGGVGDKTSITLAPILASLDIGVAKLTGRGLGHTGGTLDKFESIEGFRFANTLEDMHQLLSQTGIGLMGYSDNIVPLDKKLYTLRDVTGTVGSIPLIASSIMSKKLAIGSDAILLDVKVGNGTFMETLESARDLARTMFEIGKSADRNIACLLTNMNQPLGRHVGNALEFIEAVETIKGNGPEDFNQLIYYLTGATLLLKDNVKTTVSHGVTALEQAVSRAKDLVHDKKNQELALQHLASFIEMSGGNPNVVYDYGLLPSAKFQKQLIAEEDAYISGFETSQIGVAAMVVGAGRSTKEDVIDSAVGVAIFKKQGDLVKKGDVIAEIHYNDAEKMTSSYNLLKQSIKFSKERVEKPPIVYDFII